MAGKSGTTQAPKNSPKSGASKTTTPGVPTLANARTYNNYVSWYETRHAPKAQSRSQAATGSLGSITDRVLQAPAKTIDINQEILRRQELENNDFAQNTMLKRKTINRLFWFLAIETGLIFMFSFFQGTHAPHNFHLEEWSFKLLVTATIAQITGMLFVAVRYLFPVAHDEAPASNSTDSKNTQNMVK